MDTGRMIVIACAMAAGAAGAQPSVELLVGQSQTDTAADLKSHRLTGAQSIEPARAVMDDFSLRRDATVETVRVYSQPTQNIYAVRLRLVELDESDDVVTELVSVTRRLSAIALGYSGDGLLGYEFVLDEPIEVAEGVRIGIEAQGQLLAPLLGNPTSAWGWAAGVGDGTVLQDTGSGFERTAHSGVAFEILGQYAEVPCVADVNGDGLLSPTDFGAWVIAYNARDPKADQNADGLVLPNDFSAWIVNYSAGC